MSDQLIAVVGSGVGGLAFVGIVTVLALLRNFLVHEEEMRFVPFSEPRLSHRFPLKEGRLRERRAGRPREQHLGFGP